MNVAPVAIDIGVLLCSVVVILYDLIPKGVHLVNPPICVAFKLCHCCTHVFPTCEGWGLWRHCGMINTVLEFVPFNLSS